jgi:hypothetical protein
VKILGVTVLTSLAEDDLRAEGVEQPIAEMVKARARIAGARRDLGAGVLAARESRRRGRGARGCSSSSPDPAGGGRRVGQGRSEARRDRGAGDRGRRRLPGRRAADRDAADPARRSTAMVREVESAV